MGPGLHAWVSLSIFKHYVSWDFEGCWGNHTLSENNRRGRKHSETLPGRDLGRTALGLLPPTGAGYARIRQCYKGCIQQYSAISCISSNDNAKKWCVCVRVRRGCQACCNPRMLRMGRPSAGRHGGLSVITVLRRQQQGILRAG